jgi:glucokinase
MILGIEIGGTKLQLVLGDKSARIQERRRYVVQRTEGAAGIRRQIENAIGELARYGKPEIVGVGFGGPVDWKTGKISRSHHIEGWSGYDLGEWLQSLTKAQVYVDNDANVAALGEALHGAGVGFDPAFYVTLGSGVGGGLVAGGEIYHGATPGEAEIGHVRLERGGPILESRCSGWAMDARIRELRKSEPDSALCRMTAGQQGGEARFLAAALAQGDAAARRVLHETAEDLAFGLSHAVHLFHPQKIILGGGLTRVGEALRAEVARCLRPNIMEAFAPGPDIALAALGEDAVPVGALALARISAG